MALLLRSTRPPPFIYQFSVLLSLTPKLGAHPASSARVILSFCRILIACFVYGSHSYNHNFRGDKRDLAPSQMAE